MIGITNGGAVFADLLVRKVGNKCPVVSLWANRSDDNYVNNSVNNATCDGVMEYIVAKGVRDIAETRGPRILVVDDIIASGTTYNQAMKFLKGKFSTGHIRFLPLLYKGDRGYQNIRDVILWKHSGFKFEEAEINQLHYVSWHRFPYEKDIRST